MLGLDRRGVGQLLLQGRQDLDPLDRVDAQVGVERHAQVQHLRRVARLLRHHRQQHVAATRSRGGAGAGGGRRRRRPGAGADRGGGGTGAAATGGGRHAAGAAGGAAAAAARPAPSDAGEQQRLLLLDERVQRPLGRLLRLEELLVQLRPSAPASAGARRGSAASPAGPGRRVGGSASGVGIGSAGGRRPGRSSRAGRWPTAGRRRPRRPRGDVVRPAERDGQPGLRRGRGGRHRLPASQAASRTAWPRAASRASSVRQV